MVSWKRWLGSTRHLRTLFLAVAVLLAGTLLWLGWQLARQDQELAAQRLQERREAAADLAVAALQKSLSQAEEQLTNFATLPVAERREKAALYAASLPGDSVLVLLRPGEMEAFPERRMLFYPVVSPSPGPPVTVFAEAEDYEFRQADYSKAIAALFSLRQSANLEVRAAALLRIARIQREQNRWSEALATYQEMSGISGAIVEGAPVELVTGQARLSVFEHLKRDGEARREASALLDSLRQQHWRLTRGVYEFYLQETQRAMGRAAETQETAPALALASAVESFYQDLGGTRAREGRRVLYEDGCALLALWRATSENLAVLILGPNWVRAQWTTGPGVAIGLTDLEGRTLPGSQDAGTARQSVRLASATQLPWNLLAVTTNADTELASSVTRRRLLFTALAAIAALILAGSYLVGRAVTREMAVSRMQSDFVSAVSHEFRTPLASICLLTDLLATGRVAGDADRDEYYGVLTRESQRLRRLVEGLLNFGRMEAGAMQYRFETIDPAELVLEVTREFQRDVEAAGYRVEVLANGNAPLVSADHAALASAVWNLLDNAVKYSPECRTVWADVGQEDGRAVIRVRDRGLGIPAAEQKRIFEKFARGEAAIEANIRGTGVGLALVRRIVAAHEGEIRLESTPGQGSVFTLLLPGVK